MGYKYTVCASRYPYIPFHRFGKTVFLIKEEAEQALNKTGDKNV